MLHVFVTMRLSLYIQLYLKKSVLSCVCELYVFTTTITYMAAWVLQELPKLKTFLGVYTATYQGHGWMCLEQAMKGLCLQCPLQIWILIWSAWASRLVLLLVSLCLEECWACVWAMLLRQSMLNITLHICSLSLLPKPQTVDQTHGLPEQMPFFFPNHQLLSLLPIASNFF